MKTQLLEDIGQSATLHLAPSGGVSKNKVQNVVQDIAPARAAAPVRPRGASGVWRQKPAAEPAGVGMPQPDQEPSADGPSLAELIAAVEAQLMLPQPVHDDSDSLDEQSPVDPLLQQEVVPQHEPVPQDQPVSQDQPVPQDEPVLHSAPAPRDPVLDFTPGPPAAAAPDPFHHEPSWFERSGQRYLMWGSCVLLAVLAIQAGLWFYDERKDASSLALVADESKTKPQVEQGAKRQAIAAKAATLVPDVLIQETPAAAAASPRVPLVLLQSGSQVEPAPALRADPKELKAQSKPEQLAEQAPAAPLPKRVSRTEREQLGAAGKPSQARAERVPDRQLARAPVMPAESKSAPDFTMTSTLKACREHGYDAAQCVKRACSVTKYGFVCRGK